MHCATGVYGVWRQQSLVGPSVRHTASLNKMLLLGVKHRLSDRLACTLVIMLT
jgi:hypothetical protein